MSWYYTREAGVRSLEREIANLARKAVKEIAVEKDVTSVKVTVKNLDKYAGVRKFRFGETEADDMIGVVTGLAYTSVGGDLLAFGPNADIFAGRHVLTVVRRRVHLNRTPVRLLWGHVRLRRVEDLPAGLVGALIYRRG